MSSNIWVNNDLKEYLLYFKKGYLLNILITWVVKCLFWNMSVKIIATKIFICLTTIKIKNIISHSYKK